MGFKIDDKDTFLILSPEITDGSKLDDSIDIFLDELNEKFITFKNKNIILDFSDFADADVRKILLFSQLSGKQKERNQSFVIVRQGINVDDIPDEMDITPSLKEAIDVIEMDSMQRDLGI